MRWPMLLLGPLSLSIGWGIRGNFGHEFGAMIAGALAGLALSMTSGRPDWWRRAAFFGMFGALGWSFGGSISYMQVVAYTHSGHTPSVLYGFASVFVIGFLWAAPGGAGTALPAEMNRETLTGLLPPLSALFLVWWVQDGLVEPWLAEAGYDLDWHDSDWLGALSAVPVALLWAAVRRRFDEGSSLILHLAIGWWVGFLLLRVALGLRMTPPRGDNWAGVAGLVGGVIVYLARRRLWWSLFATLVTGFLGGIGFATGVLLKLVEVTSGYETNWHSVMEQTQGALHGLALSVAMFVLARRAPRVADEPPVRRWADPYAAMFVFLLITYLNLRKNPILWIEGGTVPAAFHGISSRAWFSLAYALMAIGAVVLAVRHRSRPIALLPDSWLGRGQLLYLGFLWAMVLGNFERALPGFAAQRLVTEGIIHLNAVIATVLLLTLTPPPRPAPEPSATAPPRVWAVVAIGLVLSMASIAADWAVVRGIYGDTFAGHAGFHTRFGPDAVTERE